MELTLEELRAVAGFAVACAEPVLRIFETARPEDGRPREAIEVAREFAGGGRRTKAMRDCAWAAQRAAGEARDLGFEAAWEAGRAALAAAGAGYLHPLEKATQVKHILGAAGHAGRAVELEVGGDSGVRYVEGVVGVASGVVVGVLRRYPGAPGGGGRVGELVRLLDGLLR